MSDFYQIPDPRDNTIRTQQQTIRTLNVYLTELSARLNALENAAAAGRGEEVTGAKSGLSTSSTAATRTDLTQRTVYATTRLADAKTKKRLVINKRLTQKTKAVDDNDAVTYGQLKDDTHRTGEVTYLSANVSKTGTSWSNIGNLTFEVAANTAYKVEATINFTAGSTVMGINLAVNGPASPTDVSFNWITNYSAVGVNSRAVNEYDTSTAVTASMAGQNTARLHGTFTCGSTPGTVALRVSTDSAGSTVTVLAGSSMRVARYN